MLLNLGERAHALATVRDLAPDRGEGVAEDLRALLVLHQTIT